MKEIARRTGVSPSTVRDNVLNLMGALPVRERVVVMEHMAYCRDLRNWKKRGDEMKMKKLVLDDLPADPNADSVAGFLGVSDDEMWEACKEYERRMKQCKDPHAEFGLDLELIREAAREVSERNLMWIREHMDRANPLALMDKLHLAPRDKPAWVLRLLRKHGFREVELAQWIAADMLLSKHVEREAAKVIGKVLNMIK